MDDYLKSLDDTFFHIVLAGMGTPLQDEFLLRCKALLRFNRAFTCGGFISQTTEKLNYYPSIINRLNLRLPYRLLFEPHVRKRYVTTYPKFFIRYVLTKSWRGLSLLLKRNPDQF